MRGRPRPRLAALVAMSALTASTAAATVVVDTTPKTTTLITLSGNGNSYVDVVLPRNLTVEQRAAIDEPSWRDWTWRGCGSYRGFYLEPLDHGGVGAGAIDFAAFNLSPERQSPLPIGEFPQPQVLIPAGLTRVHLLATAPCTLSLRLSGGGGALSVRTTHRAPVRAAVADLDPSDGAGAPHAGIVRWDVGVNGGTLLETYARSQSALLSVQTAKATVTCPRETVPAPHFAPAGGSSSIGGTVGTNTMSESVEWFLPGTLPTAACTVTAAVGGPLAVRATAAYVAIDLVAPSGEGSSPPCTLVVPSPTFAKDHVLLCTAQTAVYLSNDAGRHWHRPLARGLTTISIDPWTPVHVVFSPLFKTDHTIYAYSDGGPLLESTDLGDTFAVVDPAAVSNRGMSFVPFVHTGPPTNEGRALTYVDDANKNWVLRPGSYVRTPGFDVDRPVGIAVPHRYPVDGPAFLVGLTDSTTSPAAAPLAVYACTDELTCTDRFDVPVNSSTAWLVSDGWLGGIPTRPTVQFVLRGGTDGVTAWRSLDGGRTFSSWTSLSRLLLRDERRDAGRASFALAHHPAFPHRVYLRVSRTLADRAPRTVPDEAVFRSDDDGTTWRQVAGAWSAARGGGGALPWAGFVAHDGPATFELAGDGSLFATGWVRGTHRLAVFRSTDGGVHWHEARA
jgi:hypothetical protein